MKFGIHSLLFHETFLEKDLPLLDKVKEMGFDAIEIIPFDPDGFPGMISMASKPISFRRPR